jgi:peptidyl-prolyl cis-trans isomerase D
VNEGANGAVLQLEQKVEPTAEDIAKNMDATREKLLDTKRQEAFSVFVGTLMDRYEKDGAVAYTKKQPAGPLGQ